MPDKYYFIDAENPAEMARLIDQDRLFTRAMGGIFPLPIAPGSRVLDVACGPGGWLLELGQAHLEQGTRGVGVDIDHSMIAYAKSQADTADLDNLDFEVMDIQQLPWSFEANSFDIVNARLMAFFSPEQYEATVREMVRVLKPGGIIRLTETEMSVTNSPVFEKMLTWFFQALYKNGQSFSCDGRTLAVTAHLAPLLRRAGIKQVMTAAYGIDWSYGTPSHEEMVNDFRAGWQLVIPFLLQTGVAPSEDEAANAYQTMLEELQQEDFVARHDLFSAWGRKPLQWG